MTIQGTVELWINGNRIKTDYYSDAVQRKTIIKDYCKIRDSMDNVTKSYIQIKPNYFNQCQ